MGDNDAIISTPNTKRLKSMKNIEATRQTRAQFFRTGDDDDNDFPVGDDDAGSDNYTSFHRKESPIGENTLSPTKPTGPSLNGLFKNATSAKRKASDMTGDIDRDNKKKAIDASKEASPLMNKVDDATRYNAQSTTPTEMNETETVDDHDGYDFLIDVDDDDGDVDGEDDPSRRDNTTSVGSAGTKKEEPSLKLSDRANFTSTTKSMSTSKVLNKESGPSVNVDRDDEVMAEIDDDDDNTSFRSCMYAGKKCFDDDPMPTPIYFNGLQFMDTLTPGMDISPDVVTGLVKLLQLNITHIYKNDTIIIINDPTFGAPPQNDNDEAPIAQLDAFSSNGNRMAFQTIFISEKDGDINQIGLGKSHGENPIGRWVLAIFDEEQHSATFHHWSPGSCSIFTENGKQLLRTYIQRTVHRIGFINHSADDNHVTVIWPDSAKAISPVPATCREQNEFHVSENIDTEVTLLTYCGSSESEEDSNRSGVVVLKELIHRCFLITGRLDCQGDTRNASYATGEYMKYKPSRVSSEEWLEQLSLDAAVSDLGSKTNGFKPRINANDREYIVKWFAVYFRRLLPTGVLAMPKNALGTKDRQILKVQVKAAIAFSRIKLIADPTSDSSMSSMDKLLNAIKFSMAYALTPECCIQDGRRLLTCLDCGQISHSHHFAKFYESVEDWTCQYCKTGNRWIVVDQSFKVQREIECPVSTESDTNDAIYKRNSQVLSSFLTQRQRRAKRRARAIQKSIRAGAKGPSPLPSKADFKAESIESKILPLKRDEMTEGDTKKALQRVVESFVEKTVAGACPIPRVEAAKAMGFKSSSSSDVSCMPDSLENIISCMMTENGKDCLQLSDGRSITLSTLGSYLRSELNSCVSTDDDVHADAMYCTPARMITVLDSMGISADRQKDESKKAVLKENSNCLAILNLPSTSVEGKVYTHCIAWLPSHRLLIDNSEENVLQLHESVIQALKSPVAGITTDNRNKQIHKEIANKIFKKLVGCNNISIRAWYKISMKDES